MKKNGNLNKGFGNLRDDKDQLLRFSSDEYCKEQCKNISEDILNTNIAKEFIKTFNHNDIKVFIYKKIFEDFKYYFSYIYLSKYIDNKNSNLIIKNENILQILKSIYKEDFKFTLKKNKFALLKKKIKIILKKFLIKNHQKKIKYENSSKISVSYIEGYDQNKKNDLFWFYNSTIKPNNILIYYESDDYKYKFDTDKQTAVDFFKKKGIKNIKISNFNKLYYNAKIETLFDKSHQNNETKPISLYTKEIFNEFLIQIEKWYSFFKHHNVKIDITNLEIGTDIIAKKIALNFLNGCTIKKVRSYVGTDEPRSLTGWHNEDVVLVWGKDLSKRLNNTINYPNTKVITGHYSGIKTPKFSEDLNIFLDTPNKKFLLLDNSWSENNFEDIQNGKIQLIFKEDYILFYKKILNFVKNNKKISLVVKPKKNYLIDRAKDLRNDFDQLVSEKKCYVINESFQLPLDSIISKVDTVITTSVFFPTVLYESILKNNYVNSYHYDYSNLEFKEKKIYEIMKNKIFFKSIDTMLKKIDEDLSKNNINFNLWRNIIKDIDPYNDNKGTSRVSFYIENLFINLQSGFKEDAIINTNKLFKEEYGDDKIII